MHRKHANVRGNNARHIRNIAHFRFLKNNQLTQPFYRISAKPVHLKPRAISLWNKKVRQILFSPPHERLQGFGVRGFLWHETDKYLNGIKGSNIGLDSGEIILQWNGYLQYQCPIVNSYFFWGKGLPQYTDFDDLNWLYPLVVCEHPVSFLRLVKELYAAAGITCALHIIQEFHYLWGLTLPSGAPNLLSLVDCLDGAHQYKGWNAIVSRITVHPNFHTGRVAYGLLRDVYAAFGLGEPDIPFFDANRNFTRDSNYRAFSYN